MASGMLEPYSLNFWPGRAEGTAGGADLVFVEEEEVRDGLIPAFFLIFVPLPGGVEKSEVGRSGGTAIDIVAWAIGVTGGLDAPRASFFVGDSELFFHFQ